jgi:hypothetical protein
MLPPSPLRLRLSPLTDLPSPPRPSLHLRPLHLPLPTPPETVFYLSDMHTVEQGDKLTGELTCAPNAKNPRDLDIVIDYKVASKTGGGERREYRMA